MQQILFYLPFTSGFRPPDGVPLYGFGAMLFITFFLVTIWGGRRAAKVGLPKDRLQDMAILLFLTGIAGARLVYMIQYYDEQFKGLSPFMLVVTFFEIWNGGIVFYGSIFGGGLGYLIFRKYVLKRLGINGWQLADAVAPMLAIGMAVGRIGCYLNGCCWGQVACEECQPVPLSAHLGQFPLLPSHARRQVTFPPGEKDRLPEIHGLQTTTGFSLKPRDLSNAADPRAVIAAIEIGSAAEVAGLQPGDRIIEVNGKTNFIVLEVSGAAASVTEAEAIITAGGGRILESGDTADDGKEVIAGYDSQANAMQTRAKLETLRPAVSVFSHDGLWEIIRTWPRGKSSIELVVERNGAKIPVSYTPRTVTFFPTQVYETVSMVLLTFLLVSFQTFRRHDGQVMVGLMLCYAIHRFINEAIRIEPTYAFGLTLSQWISVGIFTSGVLLEVYLRWSQPKLPPGENLLGYGKTVSAAPE